MRTPSERSDVERLGVLPVDPIAHPPQDRQVAQTLGMYVALPLLRSCRRRTVHLGIVSWDTDRAQVLALRGADAAQATAPRDTDRAQVPAPQAAA